MRPDPDREQRWQARIAEELAAAPRPDPRRLAAALAEARHEARRARRLRRTGVGVAAALVLGSAAAGVGWWSTPLEPEADRAEETAPATMAPQPGEPASRQAAEAPRKAEPDSADGHAHGATTERRDAGKDTAADSPVIYRRAR
mgnify:CR=1 FL=1